jgi:hypothetical protein
MEWAKSMFRLILEQLLLLRRQDAVEHLMRVVGREVRDVLVPLELSVDAHGWRRANRDVQVGRIARDHALEQSVD